MRYPSIKTLCQIADVTPEQAREIRAIMAGPGRVLVAYPGASDRHDARHVDGEWKAPLTRMERIDRVLGTFGVEHVDHGRNAKSPAFCYCNAGDPYTTTLLFVGGAFRVGNWGAYVERGNYA
jgi:hypothetical protein